MGKMTEMDAGGGGGQNTFRTISRVTYPLSPYYQQRKMVFGTQEDMCMGCGMQGEEALIGR